LGIRGKKKIETKNKKQLNKVNHPPIHHSHPFLAWSWLLLHFWFCSN